MQLCSHDPIRRHATSKIVRQREIYLILFSIDILMISMTIENEKKERHMYMTLFKIPRNIFTNIVV
jgi:hypothetical protein